MASNSSNVQAIENEKKKRVRSPNYPTVGLKEAIDRVKRFVNTDGRAGAVPAMAAKHIGFASAHGQAYSVLSALKKFGLLEDKEGRVVPTQRAMEIVNLPDADERRKKAIRDAAISPSIYAELIREYGSTGLPSDETLKGELVTYKSFNPNGVGEFLKAFKETLEFAGLTDFSELSRDKRSEENKSPSVKPGDWVQWVSQGSERFHELKRVGALSDDGQFAFIEGEATGLPVSELEIGEAPARPPLSSQLKFTRTQIQPPVVHGASGMRNEVFSLDGGGEVVITWPSPLPAAVIEDIKDWLKIVERKISRSIEKPDGEKAAE